MSGSAHDALFRGHACFVDEEYTEALKHYATAIEHAPGDADAYSKRAAAHLKLNNNTEAVADQVVDASASMLKPVRFSSNGQERDADGETQHQPNTLIYSAVQRPTTLLKIYPTMPRSLHGT